MKDRRPGEGNPYVLEQSQLMFPDNRTKRREWFEHTVAIQLGGIENGVRPQNLYYPHGAQGSGLRYREEWLNRVWNQWLESRGPEHQKAAALWSKGGAYHSTSVDGESLAARGVYTEGKRRELIDEDDVTIF